MKKLFIIFAVLGTQNIFAGPPDTLWTRKFGSSSGDCAYSVCQTQDSNFVIAGKIKGNIGLIKIKPDGDAFWTNSYGSGTARSICQTKDGGFIVTGEISTGNSYDVYLTRTNTIGDTLWTKTYGGANYDCGYSVLQTKDDGFIIAGYTESFATGNNVYLIKTDCNGDSLWTKTFDRTEDDKGFAICPTQDSGFIIAGETNIGPWNIYLIKVDYKGDTIWTKAIRGPGGNYARGYSICPTQDSNFIIVGETYSYNNDIYIVKINPDGDTIWTKTHNLSPTDYCFSVCPTNDSGFVITGEMFCNSRYNLFLMKLKPNGDSLWAKAYIKSSASCGYCVLQANDGSFIVAGASNAAYVVKFGEETGIEESNTPIVFSCKSYPNPVYSNLSIEYTLPASNTLSEQEVKLIIYDISGTRIKTLVNENQSIGKHTTHWNGTNDANRKVPAGIYFYSLSAGNHKSINKFILMKH